MKNKDNYYIQGNYEEFLGTSKKFIDSNLLRQVTRTKDGVLCDVIGKFYVYYALQKNNNNEYWGIMMNTKLANYVLNNPSYNEIDAFAALLGTAIREKKIDSSVFVNNDAFFQSVVMNKDSVISAIDYKWEAELIKKFEAINGRGAR